MDSYSERSRALSRGSYSPLRGRLSNQEGRRQGGAGEEHRGKAEEACGEPQRKRVAKQEAGDKAEQGKNTEARGTYLAYGLVPLPNLGGLAPKATRRLATRGGGTGTPSRVTPKPAKPRFTGSHQHQRRWHCGCHDCKVGGSMERAQPRRGLGPRPWLSGVPETLGPRCVMRREKKNALAARRGTRGRTWRSPSPKAPFFLVTKG